MPKNHIINTIRTEDISFDELHFQYFPSRFIREVYGDDGNMMLVKNSPHCDFLKQYEKIGEEVYKNNTNYYKMQKGWGRDEKYILKKMKKLVGLYNDIKKDGLKVKIRALEAPLYSKVFDSGYEIYDGHHRASVCCILGYKTIACEVIKVIIK